MSDIAWVVNGYLLAQVASMPLYGKRRDIYGRKRVFLCATALFTIGTILCGAAHSLGELVGARVIQGLGGGGLAVLAMAIIADLVPPRQLGRWLGYQGAIFAVGGVAGPLTGGLFVDRLSWRWPFYATVPLAIAALVVGVTLPEPFVPVRLFTNAVERMSVVLNFLSSLVFCCGIFFVPVFLQDVAGVSPTVSGLLLIG